LQAVAIIKATTKANRTAQGVPQWEPAMELLYTKRLLKVSS
jgi:hypothetical protein